MIYRFVTRASVEQRITQVAKKKMMLTHLVVRPGLGSSKTAVMSKSELNDILKFGTQELFKDDNAKDGDSGDSGRIDYDEKAVMSLSDRTSSHDDAPDEEKDMLANEYLASFKVATYVVKQKDDDVEVLKQDAEKADPDYWEKLLRHHYEQFPGDEARHLGKGKRIRKQVSYVDGGVEDQEESAWTNNLSDYEDEGYSDVDEEESDEEFNQKAEGRQRRGTRSATDREITPRMLAKVHGNLEVFGFNLRQRKSFLNAVMRYGLPSPEGSRRSQCEQFARDLRGKSEKAFQAYVAMFLRHLCEPGTDNKEMFNDGVPSEGLQRTQVLTRIGIMSLIRKKVEEFAHINGWEACSDEEPSTEKRSSKSSSRVSTPVTEIVDSKKVEQEPVKKEEKEATPEKKEDEQQKSEPMKTDKDEGGTDQLTDRLFSRTPRVPFAAKEKANEEDNDSAKQEKREEAKPAADSEENKKEVSDGHKEDDGIKENNDNKSDETEPMDVQETGEKSSEDGKDGEQKKPMFEAEEKEDDKTVDTADKKNDNSGKGEEKEEKDTTKETESCESESVEQGDVVDRKENEGKKEVESKIESDLKEGKPAEDAVESDKKATDNTAEKTESPAKTEQAPIKTDPVAVPKQEKSTENSAGLSKPASAANEQQRFMFNIADGGFTELHILWEVEEKRKCDGIWWRCHDYWLLDGVVIHGYGRWQDIANDRKFVVVNDPFKNVSLEYKNRFIARRFKLLEQALVIEEQLRQADTMKLRQDANHPAMALNARFAELECFAESHQHLSKESLAGNKPANAVLHKVFNQLEELLSDMKSDVNRLPSTLVRMPPVTARLNMSERGILSRLTKRGEGPPPNVTIPGNTIQPPPVPGMGSVVIQPKVQPLVLGGGTIIPPVQIRAGPLHYTTSSVYRAPPVTGSNATITVQPPPPTTLLLSASTAT
ncbi:unnamed protein product [Porites evermanni]|uniref:CHD subfamily II SANT-like domain-containing protein n=1 Tax=Porites evermanni TaxID=104178 RepID=A0ABN8QX23_9CNID|nr:unnamed protein product [Porites evermanni]